jgi:RHS repeat-associated protein
VLTKVDGLGHTTTYAYDAIYRVSTITDPLGNVTTYSYTANPGQGKVETDTNALGNSVTYTYNGAGEVTNIYKASGFKETFTYDADGNKTTDNVIGNTTTYGYDALNREITITNALNGVTTYVYDAGDNRTVLIDSDGNRTTFAYDSDNRLTTQTDPLNHSSTFAYNAVGELTSKTDNNGRRDDFTYDADGRKLTEKWYNSSGTLTNTQTFTYDAIGEMLTAVDPNGTNTFTYDHLQRVATVNEPFGLTLTYTYDAGDNRTAMQDSKGGLETFSYDAGNRLTQVQFTGQGATLSYDYGYDKIGEITSLKRYSDLSGVTTVGSSTWGYDGRGNVTGIYHYDSTGSTIQSFAYTWDNSDRLTHKVINGVGTDLSYDATNQLKNDGTNTYTYDANGNRNMSGYSTTANEITSDGTWNYTYDNEGNRTKMVSIATGATWKFTYDNHNHLTAANYYASDGGQLLAWVNYKYDALGHYIERDASSGQQTIRYGYDGDNAWVDMDGSNNLATRRLYGPGFDNPVVKISSAGVVVWYLLDYQNSVIGMVSATGASLGSVTYDGFGKVLTNTLGSYADAYLFQGARRDTDTGMDIHNDGGNGRWYDPNTGTWISRDRGGFAMGDANLYRYVGNNSTTWIDPTGMFNQGAATAGGISGMVAGGVAGAAIGSLLFPGGGTVAGAAIGGMIGLVVGYFGEGNRQDGRPTDTGSAIVNGGNRGAVAAIVCVGGVVIIDKVVFYLGSALFAPAAKKAAEAQQRPDVFRSGNAQGPYQIRVPRDITPDVAGNVGPTTPPSGLSVSQGIDNVATRGRVWVLPGQAQMPSGLSITPDEPPPGHMVIGPTSTMSLEDFLNLLNALPWVDTGIRK